MTFSVFKKYKKIIAFKRPHMQVEKLGVGFSFY